MQKLFVSKSADLRVRAADAYIYVMLLLFPLFTGFHGYTKITASKFVFFETATLALLAVVLFASRRRPDRLALRTAAPAEKLLLVYLALCVLSAVLSPVSAPTPPMPETTSLR